ncbi:siderophore ABC transporter substrate-binding protein [Viridibacillus sp. YIM B01967]|uniref:Siderophore ABC transporter substrate-binding protein n=1 Tax=Viridibacillus soli TaxID=2798301 RepID=A0ABS1H594_9BACL|nr:siderophore ABC transporter substrate-binding protein [Viridibacillus soli]MBK3494587.1 siderophore ABC transporter substrate-binding protein [Viridibacillus soli]
MKNWKLLTLVFAMLLVLAACGSKEEKKDETSGEKAEEITITNTFGIEKDDGSTDDIKEEVKVKKNPEKVVVFDLGFLDTLDTLGVEIAALPKELLPDYLKKFEGSDYTNAGQLKEPDFEAIAALKPDVIFISGRQASLYEEFKKIAPTVYVGLDSTKYMESFKANAELAGKIFGKEDQVKDELKKIDDKIAGVKEKASALDKKALILLGSEGKVTAYGPQSRFGLIHDVFGFKAADENIKIVNHGNTVSFEYVLDTNPDIIFIVDRDAAVTEGASSKGAIENTLVKKTNAYKDGKMIYLDPAIWYLSGGGLKSVSLMVDEVEVAL